MNYNNKNIKIIDGMIFDTDTDTWVEANEYIYYHNLYHAKLSQAKDLQSKISKQFKLK